MVRRKKLRTLLLFDGKWGLVNEVKSLKVKGES
jgi:hypothetical protein